MSNIESKIMNANEIMEI